MESLYLLIPVSVVLVFLIGGIFWWSLKSGQLEDLEGPGYKILMDDDRAQAQDSTVRKDGKRTSVDADQIP
jgi:cbb3-type cytochrome oxidase maturation protein